MGSPSGRLSAQLSIGPKLLGKGDDDTSGFPVNTIGRLCCGECSILVLGWTIFNLLDGRMTICREI